MPSTWKKLRETVRPSIWLKLVRWMVGNDGETFLCQQLSRLLVDDSCTLTRSWPWAWSLAKRDNAVMHRCRGCHAPDSNGEGWVCPSKLDLKKGWGRVARCRSQDGFYLMGHRNVRLMLFAAALRDQLRDSVFAAKKAAKHKKKHRITELQWLILFDPTISEKMFQQFHDPLFRCRS